MKDNEIFGLLEQSTGITSKDVMDFRPCSEIYNHYDIPTIPDAITIQLKGNGKLIYIPDRDIDGKDIIRKM